MKLKRREIEKENTYIHALVQSRITRVSPRAWNFLPLPALSTKCADKYLIKSSISCMCMSVRESALCAH